jgi:hypothetical protein
MLPSHRKAMRDIERCRTAELGGQVLTCEACGEAIYQYHSCRDRHCPKCQNDKAQQWLEKLQDLLPPTFYFMLTFTLPEELRRLARSHQRLFYDLLFRASAAASQFLAQDPRFVGGQLGMIGLLHTWTRSLVYHPHVHYLVPGGGLADDGQWLPARASFLLPVKALSRIFRAKFRDALRELAPAVFAQVPAEVWKKDWVVHCKRVGNGLTALKYLAPYVFRVAISNKRILGLTDGKVTFRYRQSDTGKLKVCTLLVNEFIRRFLQHVLPRGFVKVRYYGFFASGCRPRLAALREYLDSLAAETPSLSEAGSKDEPADKPGDPDVEPPSGVVLCPSCGRPMRRSSIPPGLLIPRGRSPI